MGHGFNSKLSAITRGLFSSPWKMVMFSCLGDRIDNVYSACFQVFVHMKKKLAYPNSLEVVTMVATLQPQVVGCCFAPSMY